MAFQPAINCAEATLNAVAGGQAVANVLHFYKPSGYDQTDLDTLAELIDDTVAEGYKTLFPSTTLYVATVVKGLASPVDLQSIVTASAGPGPNINAAMPNSAALCVTLRTANTGRSARGRFYAFPPTRDFQSTPTEFNPDWGVAVKDFLEALQIALVSSSWQWVVLSRFHAGVERVAAVAYPVTAVQVRSNKIASQRGRLAKK